MRRLACTLAVCLAVLPAASTEAKLLDLYVGPRVGLLQGGGDGSLRGLGVGFELGAEVLLFDAIVNYHSVLGGKQAGATLTQLLLAIDGDLPIDGRSQPQTFVRIAGAAGFGIVTPKAPDFPIDSSEISNKGLVLQGTAALERHLNRFVIVGFELAIGYHYFLSRAKIESSLRPQAVEPPPPMTPKLEEQWAHGMQFMGLLTARVHFEPLPR